MIAPTLSHTKPNMAFLPYEQPIKCVNYAITNLWVDVYERYLQIEAQHAKDACKRISKPLPVKVKTNAGRNVCKITCYLEYRITSKPTKTYRGDTYYSRFRNEVGNPALWIEDFLRLINRESDKFLKRAVIYDNFQPIGQQVIYEWNFGKITNNITGTYM